MSASLIVLHGWSVNPESRQKWQPFLDELTQAGHQPTFLPIPGLLAPLDSIWTLDDYVSWLEDQLKDQSEVILLGHSFGGQLSIRYAALHPEQISKLVLIDSAGIRDRSLKAVLKRNIFGVIAKLGKIIFPKSPQVLRKLLYILAREKDYFEASELQRQTMANVISQETLSDAKQIHQPTLIVWGDQDKTTPLENGETYQSLIKNSELIIIQGARHSPQFTHVTETANVIKRFLTRK